MESKENQMQITELSEYKASGEEMGGDLNRPELPKIEDYSKRMATWFMLKEGGFIPFMQSMKGYDENCSL